MPEGGFELSTELDIPREPAWTVTDFDAPTRLVVEIQGTGYGMTEAARLEAAPKRAGLLKVALEGWTAP